MTDPFAPQPVETKELTDEDIYFTKVDRRGNVTKFKMESGVPVKVEDLGNVKDIFTTAIHEAAMLTPESLKTLDFGGMSHIKIAAIKIAVFAAAGDLKSAQELFDRVLGKPKLISENTNLNLTIDDVLNGIQGKKGEVIDVEHHVED